MSPENEISETELQKNYEYVRMAHSEWLEIHKGVRESAISAVRTLFLLNGGALIALLALAGNMYRVGHSADFTSFDKYVNLFFGHHSRTPFQEFVQATLPAFTAFGLGLLFAGIVALLSYLVFGALEGIAPRSSELLGFLRMQKIKPKREMHLLHRVAIWGCILFSVVSIAAFGSGCMLVRMGFNILAN